MPSFTDTSNGYVQWQSARRHAKQLAQDAAIDIIEHYNRVVLKGDRDVSKGRYNGNGAGAVGADQTPYGVLEEDSPRLSKKLTPRSLAKKTTTLKAESLDRKGGVFTEGISSLSRQAQFPVSLKRSDILSDNQPDSIMLAREKSRIYLALSHPGPKQTASNKGDQSAKSVRTLPPSSSSYPWADMLSVTEIVRSKNFAGDERAGLVTRSSLDSRQTASDTHPATDRKVAAKLGTHLPLFYPSITGAPPNTPLQMAPPAAHKPKIPAVNIVSLDGETVTDNGKKNAESRSRLPVPFRSMVTVSGPVSGGDAKASSKPGIDLPHLPLRYAESKEPSTTPRERPGRMNYFMHSKARRRTGAAHMKHVKIKTTADQGLDDAADSKNPVTDPYANRFQQTSSVTSLGEAQALPPSRPGEGHRADSEADGRDPAVREPTIMLTVEEEDESGEKGSPPARPSPPRAEDPQPEQVPGLEVTPQAVLAHQVKVRTQSLVSNASLLSVPLNVAELSEARPPNEPALAEEEAEPVTLEIPVLAAEAGQAGSGSDPEPEPEPGDKPASGTPNGASGVSAIDTARTVATQTSLPYDADSAENRPAVVKIKTLGMFPDINGGADGQSVTGDRPCSRSGSEPLLRMTHGDSNLEGRLLGLPELKGSQAGDRHLEEEMAGLKRRPSGVQNMTFISPLDGQQKAKRF